MKEVVLILSAPRSGSSFLTSVVKELGYSTGKNEAQIKDSFNEKGYFENSSILNFNEKVLTRLGSSIFTSKDLSTQQELNSLEYKEELTSIISHEYTSKFVIKDPRIVVLRKLYNTVFKELKVPVKTVALFRNKSNSAKSIDNMVGIGIVNALKSVNYYQDYLNSITQEDHVHKLFLEDVSVSSKSLEDLAKFLNVRFEKKILNFFEPNLMNYK
mgnify:CR=1 FL=1